MTATRSLAPVALHARVFLNDLLSKCYAVLRAITARANSDEWHAGRRIR